MLSSRVYEGNNTPKVRAKFSSIVQSAAEAMIRETVNRRLRDAIQVTTTQENEETDENSEDSIITTDSEIKGFHIIQAIASKNVSPERVVYRDSKAYCAILLDDNNRKPICRLHFNNENRMRFSLGREPIKHDLAEVRDIYKFAEQIRKQITSLDAQT